MDIKSSDNSSWLIEALMEDVSIPTGNFSALVPTSNGGFSLPSQPFNCSSPASVEVGCSFGVGDGFKEVGSPKRSSAESSSSGSGSKAACREKLRRNKLNERLVELGSILEPEGKHPKRNKTSILIDAVQTVTQLRSEVQKLSESNEDLKEKIKELEAEKKELRDEKQILRADKKKLERLVKATRSAPQQGFLPHLSQMSAAYAAQGQVSGSNMMPFISYPSVGMCQFMAPAAINKSDDDSS